LPQNLLGLLVIFITGASYEKVLNWENEYIAYNFQYFGVSLGKYIIFGKRSTEIAYKHECGHCKQSEYLGWFYLLIIGLPSLLGNIYDRIFHQKWNNSKRVKWYYSQPWEAWADKLGNVKR